MKLYRLRNNIFLVLGIIAVGAVILIAVKFSKLKPQNLQGSQFSGQPAQSAEIVINSPSANQVVDSPLEFSGKVKGGWFFEASFPVELLDQDGSVLGQSAGEAIGDWQTTNFVDFSGKLTFQQPKGQSGTLLFENDNPSGLSQNHKEYRLPVKFSPVAAGQPQGTCSPDNTNCQGNPALCMTDNLNRVCN